MIRGKHCVYRARPPIYFSAKNVLMLNTKGRFPDSPGLFLFSWLKAALLKRYNFIPGNENRHSSDKHKRLLFFLTLPEALPRASVSINTFILEGTQRQGFHDVSSQSRPPWDGRSAKLLSWTSTTGLNYLKIFMVSENAHFRSFKQLVI